MSNFIPLDKLLKNPSNINLAAHNNVTNNFFPLLLPHSPANCPATLRLHVSFARCQVKQLADRVIKDGLIKYGQQICDAQSLKIYDKGFNAGLRCCGQDWAQVGLFWSPPWSPGHSTNWCFMDDPAPAPLSFLLYCWWKSFSGLPTKGPICYCRSALWAVFVWESSLHQGRTKGSLYKPLKEEEGDLRGSGKRNGAREKKK